MTNYQRLLLIRDVLDYYGFESQMDMMMEKCAELVVAIVHYKKEKEWEYKMVEELADVWILLVQMAEMLGSKDVIKMVDSKLENVERVISELKNN